MTNHSKQNITLPCPAKILLQHRHPMLLLDHLTTREGNSATAIATMKHDNIFISDNQRILPEYFIEIMAQTMAAARGYDALFQSKSPKGGYIIGVDNCTLHHPPEKEFIFHIKITEKMDLGSMKVIEGKVLSDSFTIATATIKVWEQ